MRVSDADIGKEGTCVACGKPMIITRELLDTEPEPSGGGPVDIPDVHPEEEDVAVDWNVGDVILNLYEVTDVLGEGGMGKVYKVYHRGWKMFLAVKSPKAKTLARRTGAANFERECETWIGLGVHPHTVTCYYVRRLGGVPRVFAEFVEGNDLWSTIKDESLYADGPDKALRRIVDIGIQFAWGLQHAHNLGVVHQDVKPANLMLTANGAAKVTDFGLARAWAASEEGGVSNMGMTRAYCSPEQARRMKLTTKTDIWSWGLSILEMFSGKARWGIGTKAPEALESHLKRPARPELLPPMPRKLANLLRTCFAQNPNNRPPDMNTVAKVLEDIYFDLTGTAYPRQQPPAAEALADSLNNRAVSLTDLGRIDQALTVWARALKTDPHHPESVYNMGLTRWRSGQWTDEAFLGRLQEVVQFHPGEWTPQYLIAQIHFERGVFREGADLLKLHEPPEEFHEVATSIQAQAESNKASTRTALWRGEDHNDAVTAVAWAPDNRYILTGSEDNTVKLWKPSNGECMHTLSGHTNRVTRIKVTWDGQHALSSSVDRTVRVWDLSKPICLATLGPHPDVVSDLAISSDGSTALAACQNGQIIVWDAPNGRDIAKLEGHRGSVAAVAVDAAGERAFSGGADQLLRQWELTGQKHMTQWSTEGSPISALDLAENGETILVGHMDGTITVWNVPEKQRMATLKGHAGRVTSVSLNKDGTYALSSAADRTVRLWHVGSGRCQCTFVNHNDAIEDVCFQRDGQYAASVGRDKALQVYFMGRAEQPMIAQTMMCRARSSEAQLSAAQAFARIMQQARQTIANGDILSAARFIREARSLPGRRRTPDAMNEWRQLYTRLPRVQLAGAWETHKLGDGREPIRAVSLTWSGRYALVLSGTNSVRVWDLVEGMCIRTFPQEAGEIQSIAMSNDGHTALTGGWETKAWDANSGTATTSFERQSDLTNAIALSPDSRYVLSGHGNRILLWHTETGRVLRAFTGHTAEVTAIIWSPDGQYAVSAGADKRLRVWNVRDGSAVANLEGHTQPIRSMVLSFDGRLAMSGTGDLLGRPGELVLWDLTTFEAVRRFEGHTGSIDAIDIDGGGRFALSGGQDKTPKLWDLATGQRVYSFEEHDGAISAVAIGLDGRFAVTGGKDGLVRVWALDWELEDRQTDDWDDEAAPHLRYFLIQRMRYATDLALKKKIGSDDVTQALTRKGRPTWDQQDMGHLFYRLGCAGYGYLHPDDVIDALQTEAKSSRLSRFTVIGSNAAGSGILDRLKKRFT
jgi:WD40 repeat protein